MPVRKFVDEIAQAFGHATAPGLVLIAAAAAALIVMNSGLAGWYEGLLSTPFTISFGDVGLSKALILWINDFLMAIFFLLVGLEIKREVLIGNLADRKAATLPVVAAVGGMVVPAAIYALFNGGDPDALRGWAIPAATDIAFALGVLALLGTRVPAALKIFLLALAIIDDLGAILIIAIFYTADLSFAALGTGAAVAVGLFLLNRFGVKAIIPYILLGLVLWVAVLKSGVHATLAGVVVAFAIPLRGHETDAEGPLHYLEHALVPWVAFGIMPVFAFANAGVSLAGLSFSDLAAPIPAGIALGLFLGKQLGVFGCAFLAVRAGLCTLPSGVNWIQIYGAGLLAGIGFTMSLFIGNLAFATPDDAAAVRIGVLSGSILSALCGYLLLRFGSLEKPAGV
ncbi:MAG: Na+/H+ antiporter NhaA [Alphaproteobacteria bacterium]